MDAFGNMAWHVPATGSTGAPVNGTGWPPTLSGIPGSVPGLSDAAGVTPGLTQSNLPTDFRVQMQMLYWMAEQRQLVQEMLQHQGRISEKLEGMRQEMAANPRTASVRSWKDETGDDVKGEVQDHDSRNDEATFRVELVSTLERTESKIDRLQNQQASLEKLHQQHMLKVAVDTNGACNPQPLAKEPKDAGAFHRGMGNGANNGVQIAKVQRTQDRRRHLHQGQSQGHPHLKKPMAEQPSRLPSQATLLKADQANVIIDHPVLEGRQSHAMQLLLHAVHHDRGDTSSRTALHRCTTVIADSTIFNALCFLVIMLNTIFMGVAAGEGMEHAIGLHVDSPDAEAPTYATVNYLFLAWYSSELCLKIYAHRWEFFNLHLDGYWNIFDLLLVFSGAYDVVMDEILDMKSLNITWIRLLRMFKMIKMLRVVRVMRNFQQMRTMLKSITSSMITLVWAVLVLVTIQYIFGLCFMFGLTGHLLIPTTEVEPELMEIIESYWSTVPRVLVSLFMALTGGADWEDIAVPIRETGTLYFSMFLFYIIFGMVTVMNVMTGLIVDNAFKATMEDEAEVVAQIFVDQKAVIKELDTLYDKDPMFIAERSITWEPFQRDLLENKKVGVADRFLKVFEISISDAYRVFNMFENIHAPPSDDDEAAERRILLDSFVTGCSRARGDRTDVELYSLTSQSKRLMGTVEVLMKYIEDRFDEAGTSKVATSRRLWDRLETRKLNPLGDERKEWDKDWGDELDNIDANLLSAH